MKPLKLLLSAAVALGVITCAGYFTKNKFKERFKESEAEEVLTAFEMMGLWGEMRAYPFAAIPEGKFNNAFKKMKLDEERKSSKALNGMNSAFTTLQSSPWVPLAPKNFAGRILCLGFHPTNQNIIWAGSASGGLWKTTNGGTGAANGINWTNVPTGFPVLGISTIAINPGNANEIYVGTGEVYNTGGNGFQGHNDRIFRGSYGIGIIKTTDGGNSWTKSLDFSASSLKGVADIVVNPLRTSTIYAATTDGVYRSFNSGASWGLIHSIPMAMDICMKPGDTSTLFVGAGNFGSTGNGIYKSPGPLRIGLMTNAPYGSVAVHPDCVAAAEATGRLLESLGHGVEASYPKALDDPDYTGHFITFWAAGSAWNLDYWSRRTGDTITEDDVEPLTWALAQVGRSGSAADWLSAREWLQANAREVAGWWTEGHDLLLTPTIAEPPPPLGTFDSPPDNPLHGLFRAAELVPFTPPFNVTGQPAVSLPLHWSSTGLPIGVQLVAPFGREDLLLRVAAQLEVAQPWADRRPPVHA